ncbi:Rpn family recombination-promoting nuclease/putative transposase [Bacillus wiedmannii]|uniref:Rpn family recombination-promoting nuclease/putative transposase n=1 Tax=Bacillus wiedmannii TaxID=1890302 RepID=UPI001D6C7B01|nr:Rpn family recombination-promoting nuclease/putative transposase [Bacillus wiedmannii]MBG9830950.1 hypothetical protein [Bacillus wiedmannii]UOB97751.1 PD-(D/E)XK nuclease family transposase [Bacillus wiedmannii]
MFSQQLVNLRIDFAFKQLFGTNGSEDILIAFLNAMLQKSLDSPITSLQLEDPHLHREYEEDKLSILDISATLNTGTKVNVEMTWSRKTGTWNRLRNGFRILIRSHSI